jgi:uncharacterized protein (DUF1330 family)
VVAPRRRLSASFVNSAAGANLKEKFMSVIVLVQGTPHPERKEMLAEYQKTARAVIAKHGGQAVAMGSGLGSFYGSGKFQVGIAIRFPDQAAAEGWYNDPDYQKVLPLRNQAYTALEINMFQE